MTTHLSTMRTSHRCGEIIDVRSVEELREALDRTEDPIIIGDGSNVLFAADTDRSVIRNSILYLNIVSETDEELVVEVGAGNDWHETVLWALSQNLGGIENLSLIPGRCGAAPMQNIGAYGVEIADVLLSVDVLDRSSLRQITMSVEECELGYRDSIFKRELQDQVVITGIALRLSKAGYHTLKTTYGAIEVKLESMRCSLEPTINDISEAVIAIRRSKLPDPKEIPNCGSFFKNPIISKEEFSILAERYPDLPSYHVDQDHVKVPAGWLIDRSGLRGYRRGDVGTHERQALVLVNYGEPDGSRIIELANYIQEKVFDQFRIAIEPEVNLIGSASMHLKLSRP
ncbi:MAG: UDP-N-acetylmuramate dehydrogenase [Bacteroidota bacterium]